MGGMLAMGGSFILAWLEEWPTLMRAEIFPVVSLAAGISISCGPIWTAVIRALGFRLTVALGGVLIAY